MRYLLLAVAALPFVVSMFLIRIVFHGYTDHGQLDVFHLIVAIAAALIGGFLLRRALRMRSA